MNRSRAAGAALALGLALCAAATPLHAQLRPFQFAVGGGPSFPAGDLGDYAETGYHVQGSVGLGIPLLPLALRADLLFQELPDELAGSFRQVGGLLNAELGFTMPLARPYLLGGVGVVRQSSPAHPEHAHGGDSETGTAFQAGAGLRIGFLGLGALAEVRYLGFPGDGAARSFPLTLGITF